LLHRSAKQRRRVESTAEHSFPIAAAHPSPG